MINIKYGVYKLKSIANRFVRRKILPKYNEIISSLVLKSEATKGIGTTELIGKIIQFCQLYSGMKYYPYQEQFAKRIVRSVLENDGEEITALFSRQSGKSQTIANTVGGLMIILPKLANMPMFATDKRLQMFKVGFYVGIFAPSQRQAQTTYGRMKARLQSNTAIAILEDEDFRLEFSTSNGQTVALTNGSFATAISASDNSNIEGESFMFIIQEEAQDISDFKANKSISPMGASYNATTVKIGTATTFKSHFYSSIERNKVKLRENKNGVRNHFEYDYKVVMKYNERYAKYIAKEIYRLGENSDEFRMSYALQWILERGMFIDIEALESLCGRENLTRVMEDKEKVHIAGVDLAKVSDSTVVTIVEVDWENPVIVEKRQTEYNEDDEYTAYEVVVKDWLEIEHNDYEKQYYELIDYLSNFNVRRLMIDATAEGSFADRLNANLDMEVIPCNFNSKFKSDMYKHLESEMKAGRLSYPEDEETKKSREYQKFKQQFGELQKGYRGQYMVVSHPPTRQGRDDFPDSLALAVYGAKDVGQIHVIESIDNNPLMRKKEVDKFYTRRNMITARRR